MPTLRNPVLEHGRAILLEAYAGDPILGVRTHRYLYTEWDTKQLAPEVELYDTYADPYQLNNVAKDPNYASVVADLRQQLRALTECAGAGCQQHPTGRLDFSTGGAGPGDCAVGPIIARTFTTNVNEVVSVDFRVGTALAGTVSVPPFDLVLPDKLLRDALPKPAEVVAEVGFGDGRRLALPAKIKACERRQGRSAGP
jgi:hypothetical protein